MGKMYNRQKFNDDKARLDDISLAEQRAEKDQMRECDWNDPDDYMTWRRIKAREQREALLDKLVFDRVCPKCDKMKAGLRSWVIDQGNRRAICRSCYFQYVFNDKGKTRVDKYLDILIFLKVIRFKLNGMNLRLARRGIDLNQGQFGRLMGWSSQYQGILEYERRQSVGEEKMALMIGIFEGVVKEDDEELDLLIKTIIREEEIRFKIDRSALMRVRFVLGISQAELARRAGYVENMITGLETGRVKTISKEKRDILIKTFDTRYRLKTRDFVIS